MKKVKLLILASAAVLMAACNQKSNSTETVAEQAETVVAEESVQDDPVIVLESIDQMPANDRLTVIDFNATWCGPCKRFAPEFHATAQEFAGQVNFVSVDVDKFPELAQQYGVQGIPHVAFVQPDGTVDSAVGTDQLADFSNLVKAHLPR